MAMTNKTEAADTEINKTAAKDTPEDRELALNPKIDDPLLEIKNLSLWYGDNQALHDISMKIPKNKITAFIGPSGCGKSTLLRCINRLNDMIPIVRAEGSIEFDGSNLLGDDVDINLLRKRVGMVFQKYNPFPKTIFENVVFGLRLQGINDSEILDAVVEKSLRGAALWDEVKDRLDERALGMSGGQQQRLCIARAIAVEPDVILYDEPCSALDPISTTKVEQLMLELKKDYTQVIVTHNMQQASRISDYTAFMYLGELIEYAPTSDLFVHPRMSHTEDYITGRFG